MLNDEVELKTFAFHPINILQDPLQPDVIDDECDVDSFSDHDFGFDDPSEGEIRTTSGQKLLIVNILQTYRSINPALKYKEVIKEENTVNFTFPCEGVYNNGKDNKEYHLICSKNDEIKSPKGVVYTLLELLGQGISGQVFRVVDNNGISYALKIIKNRRAYLNQALIELKLLSVLNNEIDKNDQYHIVRMIDYFYYCEHLCIVFELLKENLYQLLQHTHLEGISLRSVKYIMKQILEAVEQMHKANIIHCDLKPENILLKNDDEKKSVSIKVTDFGSACFKGHTLFKYIQSRYYRAPEVMIGKPYSTEIDMWSIGCIAVELYLGVPLFQGSCEYDQLRKVIKIIGDIPDYLLVGAKNFSKYFIQDNNGRNMLKPPQQYYKEHPEDKPPRNKPIYDLSSLDGLINVKNSQMNSKKDTSLNNNTSYNSFSFNSSISMTNEDLVAFIHFLKGIFQYDPKLRWNPKQCLRHPFITKEKIDKFLSFYPDQVSQFLYLSNDSSLNFHNSQMYHSMMMSKSFYNYNMRNNMNMSFSGYGYQPNIQRIPMQCMRNFPYAMIDQMNYCNVSQDQVPRANNTFMNMSFDKINLSNDYNYYHNKRNWKGKPKGKDPNVSSSSKRSKNSVKGHSNNNSSLDAYFNMIN